jgi:hypothetical protein
MATDGNRQFYTDLVDKNLGQADAAEDALRKIRHGPIGHTKDEVDREERAAKDAIGRAADAVRVLVENG